MRRMGPVSGRWFDVQVPPASWARREVQLGLFAHVDSEVRSSLLAGGFAEPRLIDSPRAR
jgi:hypothetical protein